MADLRRVGFWATDNPLEDAIDGLFGAKLPRAKDAIDPNWDKVERSAVIFYLACDRKPHEVYFGTSTCRICGEPNGAREFSDGVYVWPEGFLHYVLHHQVKPPADFIVHVLAWIGRAEDKAEPK